MSLNLAHPVYCMYYVTL